MTWRPTTTRRSARAAVVIASCAVLTLGLAPGAMGRTAVTMTTRSGALPAARRDGEVNAPVPTIVWKHCPGGGDLMCARVRVPLNYRQPLGATISLFMTKRPADDPADRIGSLFVNPGGPGGSAAEFVPYAAHALGAVVRRRFDIIGIDPRGVGESTPVVCKAQPGEPSLPPRPNEAFPRGPHQIAGWFAYDEGERSLCANRGNPVLDHMSTADTARDMDLIRQAVGDRQLTYYGISYGTMLGTTYAAMFPTHVRAIIVDGVLDPMEWTTGRFGLGRKVTVSARLRSGYGSWEALTSAFDECDRVGIHRCRWAGHIGTEWTKLIARLHAGAVRVQGQRITYADVIETVLGALYDEKAYPAIFRSIDGLYRQLFQPSTGARAAAARAWTALRSEVAASGRVVPTYGVEPVSVESQRRIEPEFEGVICSDSVNPTREQAAIPSAHFANEQGPGFGAAWAWISSVCINWPGSSSGAYQGPWRTRTAHPLLITGNLHDPATPISGARAVNKLFKGSVLMTVNLWGHGALGHSSCAVKKWDAYLVSGRLPAPGLVCQPDAPLFPVRH